MKPAPTPSFWRGLGFGMALSAPAWCVIAFLVVAAVR